MGVDYVAFVGERVTLQMCHEPQPNYVTFSRNVIFVTNRDIEKFFNQEKNVIIRDENEHDFVYLNVT